jgi:hypothetical protein
MIRNVLQSIAGVEIFPVISLILFLLVFGVMLVWAMRRDKLYLTELAQLPLKDDEVSAAMRE